MVRDTGLNTYHIPCMEPKITERGHWEWGPEDEVRKLDNQQVSPDGSLPKFITRPEKSELTPTDREITDYMGLKVPQIITNIEEISNRELILMLIEEQRALIRKIEAHEGWIKSIMLRINYKLDS